MRRVPRHAAQSVRSPMPPLSGRGPTLPRLCTGIVLQQGLAACQTHDMPDTADPIETTRDLLDRQATERHGFLDVLGASVASDTPTFAQRAMNSPLVAGVYERLWRPVAFYVASGVTAGAELRRATDALALSGAHRLLDIACGPGNFTGELAQRLPDD